MPLPSFRSSRSKVRRRRSHHALKPVATAKCAKCEAPILPHRACKACGAYANRSVKATGMKEVEKTLDKKAKKTKKEEKVA
ncbi:MAG: 50S ribosomal protein L32 [Patescibacteria group bacterium]